MNLIKLANEKRYGKGTSKSAERRRAEKARTTLHQGTPIWKRDPDDHSAHIVKMSDRSYFVAPDGSFRRIPSVA